MPVLGHCLDGHRHGHPAIRETLQLAQQHLALPNDLLLSSDRGTCSVEHLARWHRLGYAALCSAQGQDYRALYEANRERLHWQQARLLSLEQRRRRDRPSALPQEPDERAVLRQPLRDPTDGHTIPARLSFIYSTADAGAARQRRPQTLAKIQAGLQALPAKLQRGPPQGTVASITRQVVRWLGHQGAARYFTWQLVPLAAAEQAALPQPARGQRRPTHRLECRCDAAAAQADEAHDGLAVLVTTAALTQSADLLFSPFQQPNQVELLHHQGKTPLAVSPVFLQSPRRVEALACLLQRALQVYQVLERLGGPSTPPDAAAREKRLTAERRWRLVNVYGLLVSRTT